MESKNTKSMLDQLPPRTAFWGGIVIGGGVLFALGFIVMLVMLFKGVSVVGSATDTATTVTANTNSGTTTKTKTQPTPTQPSAAGSVDMASLTNVLGEGDITIVEYSDTECPFCKRFHPTMQQVVEEYAGQVRWAYKHFPLASLHRKAKKEAMATECAAEQGKFWEYINLLFETTPSNDGLADEELYNMAATVGLDEGQFTECLDSEKYSNKVEAELAEAQALGGTGTPFSVIVDGEGNVLETIPGALPFEQLAPAIDQILE